MKKVQPWSRPRCITTNACLQCLIPFVGLYGNDGLLPARWQLRYSGKPLMEQLLSSPTLLWLGPLVGLDTHTAMELLCLAGAALSLAATLVECLRDSVVFFCLWLLYMSLYQVSLRTCFLLSLSRSASSQSPSLSVSGGPGLPLLSVVSLMDSVEHLWTVRFIINTLLL